MEDDACCLVVQTVKYKYNQLGAVTSIQCFVQIALTPTNQFKALSDSMMRMEKNEE